MFIGKKPYFFADNISNKRKEKNVKIVLRMLGIILVVLGLFILIVSPPAGVVGIILGVLCIIRSNQKLTDKISAYIKKSREKTDQRYNIIKENLEEQKQKLKDLSPQIEQVTNNEDKERIESAGLKLYVFDTAGDERVCDACKIMDGKLCRWETPHVFSEDGGRTWKRRPVGAVMQHPGQNQACNCRCTALAYYPELIGDMK